MESKQVMPPDASESEAELVAACVTGDAAAWRRFYGRFQPLVSASAERALSALGVSDPRELAQDVTSEVFAQLLANDRAALARFQGRSKIATWLRVVARRQAGRSLRRKRPGALDEPGSLEAAGPSPSDVAQESERARIVREQIETLRPRDRLALQLFYEGERSYLEVAEALDLDPGRVGTLLARARERLSKALGARLSED